MSDPRNQLAGINLNAFPVFDALFRHQSGAAAAVELGVTPSAVSHTLRELRAVFDDPLFVRTGAGLAPTAFARSVAPAVRAALVGLGSTMQAHAEFVPAEATGRYVLSTTDEVAPNVLPAFVHILEVEAPGIVVEVRPRVGPAVSLLDAGDADLVLRLQGDAPARIGRLPLYEDTFVCVVRAGHPRIRRNMTAKAFGELGHIRVSPEGFGKSGVDKFLEASGVQRRVAVYVGTFMTALELVVATDYVCTLPAMLAATVAERSELRVLAPPLPFPSYAIELTWHVARDEPGLRFLRGAFERAVADVLGPRATR
ncbi:MAG: LysR family transcriptional regulator [Myxococcota bacterium]